MEDAELLENWINGNKTKVVKYLLTTCRLAQLVDFALLLNRDDQRILVRMLDEHEEPL